MTLGQATTEVIRSIFTDPDLEPARELEATDPMWVETRFSINLSETEQAEMEAALAALVARRNELVHGFIERHDVFSVEGLPTAIAYLDDAYAEIDRRFLQMRGWVESMVDGQQALADFLTTDQGQDLVFRGGMGAALKHAERELSEDGWTHLRKAIGWIGTQDASLRPRSFGYSSWRHLIRESGQFEVRKALSESGATEIWYRSKG